MPTKDVEDEVDVTNGNQNDVIVEDKVHVIKAKKKRKQKQYHDQYAKR